MATRRFSGGQHISSLGHAQAKAAAAPRVVHLERDSSGELVAVKRPTLLQQLIARSAGQTLPVPKKRGPKRKGGAA